MPLSRCRASRESNPILCHPGAHICREGQVNLPAVLFYGLSFDMPTDGVLRSAHQFRRFGYHWRIILRVFAVIAYALACVYSSLLTPGIARWSHGRGLFRKVHPLAGQVRLIGCQSTMGVFQLRVVRPTLGAFLRAGLGLEAHSWPQRTDKVFVYTSLFYLVIIYF